MRTLPSVVWSRAVGSGVLGVKRLYPRSLPLFLDNTCHFLTTTTRHDSHPSPNIPSSHHAVRTTSFSTRTAIPTPACSPRPKVVDVDTTNDNGPTGDLFPPHKQVGPHLIGLQGEVHRTFGPRDNAQALLVTGGPALAAHASFDPVYERATHWIQNHAVGPASLSGPVLVAGLMGALVEAAFPQAVPRRQEMNHRRPLIVGVAVAAQIKVIQVISAAASLWPSSNSNLGAAAAAVEEESRRFGYEVTLSTSVLRVRDGAVIAEGEHVIWIPDYLRM
jgi:hypothetical protein